MWRDTSRTPTLFMFDASIVMLVPLLLIDLFVGLERVLTVIFFLLLSYYLIAAFVLRMPIFVSFQYLKWNLMPKKRPSRRPVFVRRAYDIMGIASWRLSENDQRSDK